jgi:hypothetical protein
MDGGEIHFPNVYRVTMSNAKTTSELTENIFVKAKSVHDTFLSTFKGYQGKWQNFRRWKELVDRSTNVQSTPDYVRKNSVIQMSLSNFLLNLAQSFLENLSSNTGDGLQKMGFLCLLFYFSFMTVLISRRMVVKIKTVLIESNFVELFSCWKLLLPDSLIILIFDGCFLSIFLVAMKLYSFDKVPWTVTTAPLWLFIVILSTFRLFITLYTLGNRSFLKSLGFAAATAYLGIITILPLTLMGYAYDYLSDPAQYWKYCTMLYCPHLAALSLMTIYIIFDHVRLWVVYMRNGTGFHRSLGEYLPIDRGVFRFRLMWSSFAVIACFLSCLNLSLLLLTPWGYDTGRSGRLVSDCVFIVYAIHIFIFSWGEYTSQSDHYGNHND